MAATYMEVGKLHLILDYQIDTEGLIGGKVIINFHKGVRCFEAKKAINHGLEAHGYGGGEEEDR